jgi:hypothetical protein
MESRPPECQIHVRRERRLMAQTVSKRLATGN